MSVKKSLVLDLWSLGKRKRVGKFLTGKHGYWTVLVFLEEGDLVKNRVREATKKLPRVYQEPSNRKRTG